MKKAFLFLMLLIFGYSASSQSMVDSLLQLCKNAPDKQKIDWYLKISFETRDDSAKSNTYSKLAYELATKNKFTDQQAKAKYYTGETNYFAFNYHDAIPFYQQSNAIYKQLKDTFLIIECYNSIGLCYHKNDLDEKAIEQFVEGLKYCANNPELSSKLLHNIGNVHKNMHNFKNAIDYFKKALSINISIKDSVTMTMEYNSLGEIYLGLNQFDSAHIYFFKAYNLFKKLHESEYQAITLANLAEVYGNFPDSLTKALETYKMASLKFKELGNDLYQADIAEGVGEVLIKQGKINEAIKSFNLSLKLTDQYNRGLSLKSMNYNQLSKAYEKLGDYKSALQNHILSVQFTDSLNQLQRYEKIASLEKQYETEKKENQIIKLQAKQELTNIQLKQNKQLKQLGFITALLLLFLVFFILLKYFDKIKLNEQLQEKNDRIEKSEDELRILNAAKNKFFSIIAHDLKNPFHTVMGYSSLLSKDYERFTEEERKKFANDINQSTNNIFRLLQNLLEWSRSQTGKLKFEPTEIDLGEILANSALILKPMAYQKGISIQFRLDSNFKVFADKLMMEAVLRNLINNAIKFSPENSLIEIRTETTGDEIKVGVIDSGIGISENDLQNLFRIDSKVKRKGTNNEDGSGLGLILCKEFVEKNNGIIWVESTPGKGSTFNFTVPLSTNV